MAFPAVHWGSFGDEKVTSTAKINGFPLGIKMAFPDGREFVHARLGGTAAVAGKLYGAATGAYTVADTLYYALVPTSTIAAGVTSLIVTVGGTASAVTKDYFAEGHLAVASSAGTGIGYNYKIKTNNSAAAGATCTIGLYETDPIQVALAGGTTKVSITENRYAACELTPASTVGVPINGVACNSAAASSYVWLQTKGVASVFTGTALVERQPCRASGTTAGAVTIIAVAATTQLASTKESFDMVGIGLAPSVILGFSQVDLTLT